jgi:hypothetical protein
MGGAQQAYGPDDWPRGVEAYRRLYNWLEAQGQGDLRSLLIENEIAQTMDALISRAQNGTAEGLRALGVTAQLDIERFRRMAMVAPGAMARNGYFDRSPPLESFLQALELFADTFKPAGGLRLLRIARPPILFYGIYNPNLLEDDRDLVSLIMVRGNLATIFDGLFPAAGTRSAETQVLLDMLLLEIDRGIDLLALSANPKDRNATTTRRAVAYWRIVSVIVNLVTGLPPYINLLGYSDDLHTPFTTSKITFDPLTRTPTSATILVTDLNNPALSSTPPVYVYISTGETHSNVPSLPPGNYEIGSFAQVSGKMTYEITATPLPAGAPTSPSQSWGGVVTISYLQTPATGPIATYVAAHPWFADVLSEIAKAYLTGTRGIPELRRAFREYSRLPITELPPSNSQGSKELDGVLEELRVNRVLEDRWQDLVRTVAPEAGDRASVFELLRLVLEQAIWDADQSAKPGVPVRVPYEQPLPPQFEQSLAEIVQGQRSRRNLRGP